MLLVICQRVMTWYDHIGRFRALSPARGSSNRKHTIMAVLHRGSSTTAAAVGPTSCMLRRPAQFPHLTALGMQRPPRCCSFRPLRAWPSDPVVSTEWLAQHLHEVSLLDVRGHVDTQLMEPGVEHSTYHSAYDAYLEGHIPGAVFFDWTRDAIDADAGAPVQLQTVPDLLAAALEAKGVSHERPVVAYDSGNGMLAARLWWILAVAGHPCPLVLDGGWSRWKAEGRPSELYEPCTLKVYACFEAEPQLQLRAGLEEVRQALAAAGDDAQQQQQQQQLLILDTRSAEQFSGQVRRGPRGGRIPGAVSLPRSSLLDPETGWLKPLDEQRQLLQQVGISLPPPGQQQPEGSSQRVVLYCNGGVAACTAALALQRLGHQNWCVYDGSWNEWGSSDLPVAT